MTLDRLGRPGQRGKAEPTPSARSTAGYHVGEEPDERSVEVCRKHNVPINSTCRQLAVRLVMSRSARVDER